MTAEIKSRAADYLAAAQTAHASHLTKIEVPEFGGFVYGKLPTLAQRSRIIAKAGENIYDQALYSVVELALDEQGSNLFTIEHLQFLRTQVSSDVIETLAYRLQAGQSFDAIKKN